MSRLSFVCTLSLFLYFTQLSYGQEAWQNKVTTQLMEEFAHKQVTECLIVFKEQADLSGAERLYTKQQKGQFVYEALTSTAERTQGPIKTMLEQKQKGYRSFWIANAIWTVADLELIRELGSRKEVERIEANPAMKLDILPENHVSAAIDRLTPVSWGLTKIKADQVWAAGYTGTGVVVGGQDTGYEWEHPAIKNKYRGWNGATANHNYNWHDAITTLINGTTTNSCGLNLSTPCDDNAHGTHTMGTMVGATDPNNVMGVAPDAKWIGCRNMEEGDGTPATYIDCFQWFIAPTNLANGSPSTAMAPDVINNSWGCPVSEGCNSGNFATMNTVVNNVRAAGIVVVVSAGNSGGLGCSSVSDPAAIFEGSFTVGATQNTDVIAGFSSRGPVTVFGTRTKPDIVAPGVSIYSSTGFDNLATSYNYASWQGTSMAGPHVAGLVALMISARPALKGNVAMIETIIKNTSVPLYASSPFCGSDNASSLPNNVYGRGRIDALAAVNSALTVVLPVQLSAFDVRKKGKEAHLFWTTETEQNCQLFEVQRSSDLQDWKTIATVKCAGTTDQTLDYQYIDEEPLAGINYYRLKQVDLSGDATFGPAKSVTFERSGVSIRTMPQYQEQSLTFDLVGSSPESIWKLSVLSIDGRLISTYYTGNSGALELPDMPGGVYLLTAQNESGNIQTTSKFFWY